MLGWLCRCRISKTPFTTCAVKHRHTTLRLHTHQGGLDSVLMLQKVVHDFETKLDIHQTWTPDSHKWKDTEHYLNIRTYQCALDNLEGLIMAQLFELTKMNQSQTSLSFTATHAYVHMLMITCRV